MASLHVSNAASQNRAVSGYVGVKSGGSFAVTIDITGKEGARLDSSDASILDLVETVVEGGILQIRFRSNANIINKPPVLVFVEAKIVQSLETLGSSTIQVLRPTAQPQITLATKGDGHITLTVQSNSVNANSQGSSVIDISGSAQTAQITTQGSAQFNGGQLQIDSAQVSIQGSGRVEIAVTSLVTGTVQGSGVLALRGHPQEQVQTSGSGSVEHI